jgi:enoyl-CoA hydratase/carnithine racemase
MNAAEALRTGLVSAVVADDQLEAHAQGIVDDMLKAAPDALRVSKRTFDATLEVPNFDAALELEERGQIQMIRQGRSQRAAE